MKGFLADSVILEKPAAFGRRLYTHVSQAISLSISNVFNYMPAMLNRLLNILSGTEKVPEADGQMAGRVAISAILVEAARADDVYLDAERAMIDRVLCERYGLTPDEAASLRTLGEAAQAEAVDLVRFTRAIKDAVPHEDRVSVIEAVWRVILSDDERHPDENSLMRRIGGLLYVPDIDVGLARQRVESD